MNLLRETARLWWRNQVDTSYYYARHVLPRRGAIARTRQLRGTQRGRSALVFANGPSLRKLSPQKIQALQKTGAFDVFGVNAYIDTDFGRVARPDLYVLTDPAQWTMALSDEEVSHLPTSAEKSSARTEFREMCEGIWRELRLVKPRLFIPVEQEAPPGIDAFAFCAMSNPFLDNIEDITRPQGGRPLTVFRAMSIACYLGYEHIYICGVDNDAFKSTSCDRDNVKHARYEHFYDDERSVQTVSSRERLSRSLYFTALTFGSFEKFVGRAVTNLDPDGLVDCFPKQHALDVYR